MPHLFDVIVHKAGFTKIYRILVDSINHLYLWNEKKRNEDLQFKELEKNSDIHYIERTDHDFHFGSN
jgi:hypothetical protein